MSTKRPSPRPLGGNSPAASWVVAVHEMGHALQFANLGDEALPRARTCFATSSDREGWAVYLETEMAPHLSLTARASELRAEVELALGRRFRRCEYHDFLLGQGSIPFVSLRQLVFGELVAGARRRAA